MHNPFTERGRITRAERFAGRWAELSQIMSAIEGRRLVVVVGSPGIGKSSLATHVADSAAVALDRPELRGHYLDISAATAAAPIYQTICGALGKRGETPTELEVALIEEQRELLVCLDGADRAVADEWGVALIESLARIVRGGLLLIVVTLDAPPPPLSERVAITRLGRFAASEVRLLAEVYQGEGGYRFTAQEYALIEQLTRNHPAYVQRALFHLFVSYERPDYPWRHSYLTEAKESPVPGAPLPPAVFEGESTDDMLVTSMNERGEREYLTLPGPRRLPELEGSVRGIAVAVSTAAAWGLSGNPLLGLAGGVAAGALLFAPRLLRRRP